MVKDVRDVAVLSEFDAKYWERRTLAILADQSAVMRVADGRNSVWLKWDEQRETLVKSAVGCWIPFDDLRDFLNALPGPVLTTTDVAQRMRAFEDEDYFSYPKEELQPGCLAIYEREKADGTELPAIIGLLRDHVEREEERLRVEQKERYERWREEDRIAREQRLLSGADCKWTQLAKSPIWHCKRPIVPAFADKGQDVEPSPRGHRRRPERFADRKIQESP